MPNRKHPRVWVCPGAIREHHSLAGWRCTSSDKFHCFKRRWLHWISSNISLLSTENIFCLIQMMSYTSRHPHQPPCSLPRNLRHTSVCSHALSVSTLLRRRASWKLTCSSTPPMRLSRVPSARNISSMSSPCEITSPTRTWNINRWNVRYAEKYSNNAQSGNFTWHHSIRKRNPATMSTVNSSATCVISHRYRCQCFAGTWSSIFAPKNCFANNVATEHKPCKVWNGTYCALIMTRNYRMRAPFAVRHLHWIINWAGTRQYTRLWRRLDATNVKNNSETDLIWCSIRWRIWSRDIIVRYASANSEARAIWRST